MAATVSAADANREISKLLRRVREGQTVTIMSHGRPVAKLVPVSVEDRVRDAAKKALLKRLKSQKGGRIGPITWTRDELHERGGEWP
jgi:prevent-host-death family protein